MRKFWLVVLLLGIAARALAAESITVAAAADLNYALNELASRFEATSGVKVTLSFGASGNLFSQIQSGAPFDLFFSADEDYPKKLASAGLADASSLRIYALGHLVLWVPNNSTFDPQKLQMELLTQPDVTRIAIANPQHAPYGRAAEEALRGAGLQDAVKDRIVLGENISQAAQFAESGNADAGILALSLVQSPALKDKGRYWTIPENLYAPIRQGAVVPRAAPNMQGARAFLDYIKTPEVAALLERYGFALPGKGKE